MGGERARQMTLKVPSLLFCFLPPPPFLLLLIPTLKTALAPLPWEEEEGAQWKQKKGLADEAAPPQPCI